MLRLCLQITAAQSNSSLKSGILTLAQIHLGWLPNGQAATVLSNPRTSKRLCWCRAVLLPAQCRAWARTRGHLPIGMDQPLAPGWPRRLRLGLVGCGAFLRPLLGNAASPHPLLCLHPGGLGTASRSLRSSRDDVIASAANSSESMPGLEVAAGSVEACPSSSIHTRKWCSGCSKVTQARL